jgi:hypothetical protein
VHRQTLLRDYSPVSLSRIASAAAHLRARCACVDERVGRCRCCLAFALSFAFFSLCWRCAAAPCSFLVALFRVAVLASVPPRRRRRGCLPLRVSAAAASAGLLFSRPRTTLDPVQCALQRAHRPRRRCVLLPHACIRAEEGLRSRRRSASQHCGADSSCARQRSRPVGACAHTSQARCSADASRRRMHACSTRRAAGIARACALGPRRLLQTPAGTRLRCACSHAARGLRREPARGSRIACADATSPGTQGEQSALAAPHDADAAACPLCALSSAGSRRRTRRAPLLLVRERPSAARPHSLLSVRATPGAPALHSS